MAAVHDFQILYALRFRDIFFQSHVEEHDAGTDAVGHLIDRPPASGDFQGVSLALIFPAIDGMVSCKDDDGFLQFFRMQRPLYTGNAACQIGQLAVLAYGQTGQALIALCRFCQIHRFDGTDDLF